MLIEDIVTKIWEAPSREYFRHYRRALDMDAQALLDALSTKKMELVDYEHNQTKTNLLLTSGCSYRIRGQKLAGCSMCDYHTTNIDGWAMMRALRKKAPAQYAQAVRTSFENQRGRASTPAYCEQITANDCLDPIEFPAEAVEQLFRTAPLFDKEPFCYLFEVLATNVRPASIARFQQGLGRKKRLFFDFGVECTQWLRLHWLNKRVSDDDIYRAISVIKEAGSFSVADVLLGIPCLTEEQSIDEFCRTVAWLDQIRIDRITVLPLNRKETTLQGYYHGALRDNVRLRALGLVQGEHTGVPWLYTVVEALCRAFEQTPSLPRKVALAATSSELVTGNCTTPYNEPLDCPSNEFLLRALERYHPTRDATVLLDARQSMQAFPSYSAYRDLCERQKQAGTLPETLRCIVEELAETLFPDSTAEQMRTFDEELASI